MTSLPVVEASGLVKLADSQAGDTFGPRRLTDFEFVWLVTGSATWTTSPAAGFSPGQARLGVGDLALARSGAVDSYQWDAARTSRHAYVHFTLVDQGDLPDQDDWPA